MLKSNLAIGETSLPVSRREPLGRFLSFLHVTCHKEIVTAVRTDEVHVREVIRYSSEHKNGTSVERSHTRSPNEVLDIRVFFLAPL